MLFNKIISSSLVVSVLFKTFFWLTVGLLSLSLVAPVSQQTATYFDRIDLFLSTFSLLGLFGVAYSKRVLNVVFWRYFFYFGIIETLFYSISLPLVGYERYGKPFVFDSFYVFEIVYAVILLYVLHTYAYRKPFIWVNKRTSKLIT